MAPRSDRLAMYTTVYPGVEGFLSDWHRSVTQQTDRDFDLWIGLDQLVPADVAKAIGAVPSTQWIAARPGDPPGRLRSAALARLSAEYEGVILVDSDDLLAPDRVAAARQALRSHAVAGCALRLVDAAARDLGEVFGRPGGGSLADLLPRYNVFGLSNTAYRGETLAACLPIPDRCVLIDWLLATRAWALGAELGFDPEPHMAYRQHDRNVACVIPPFRGEYVRRATDLVLGHYALALAEGSVLPSPVRQALESARTAVARFATAIAEDPRRLVRYVNELNRTPPRYVWWWCVAHPDLEGTWTN